MKKWQIRELPWRNWLARSTVNRKVGGSSPPGSENSFGFAICIKEGKVKEDKSYQDSSYQDNSCHLGNSNAFRWQLYTRCP